jgi:anti-sigma regulatory factor (Ser/Thr protein kinase)
MHLTLCDYLSDVVQNAVEAGAGRVMVEVREVPDAVTVSVADDGKGMDGETLKRAFDPFYSEPGKHPGRRVGLGLPFLKQAVEQTGGRLDVKSEPGKGTSLSFRFPAKHPDTPPAGDWAGTLTALMALSGEFEMVFSRTRGAAGYAVARSELTEALGGLGTADALSLARRYIEGREDELKE